MIKPSGKGNYFNLEFTDNAFLSAYGRNNFQNYVARAKTENRILYANKEKSQTRMNTTGVQFSDNILLADYSKNLTQYRRLVKSKFSGTVFENAYDEEGRLTQHSVKTDDLSDRDLILNANSTSDAELQALQD